MQACEKTGPGALCRRPREQDHALPVKPPASSTSGPPERSCRMLRTAGGRRSSARPLPRSLYAGCSRTQRPAKLDAADSSTAPHPCARLSRMQRDMWPKALFQRPRASSSGRPWLGGSVQPRTIPASKGNAVGRAPPRHEPQQHAPRAL